MRKLIVANWKCNPTSLRKAEQFLASLPPVLKRKRNIEVVVCPSFVHLHPLKNRFSKTIFGSQDCFWEQEGPYTGAISPAMIKDAGCAYVILGHSERRRYAKETDGMVNKKLLAALDAGLKVILCVGEKEGESINTVLKQQLSRCLKKFSLKKLDSLIIAYEPVWAVGTGRPSKPDNALVAKMLIRRILLGMWKKRVIAERARIIYGGSVNRKIAAGYITEGKMDGLLVGGASLRPKEFVKIVESVRDSG